MRTLVTLLGVALALVAPATSARPARPEAPPPFERALAGRVGDRLARLVLGHSDGRLEGRLSFDEPLPSVRSPATDLRMSGSLAPDGVFEMAVRRPERVAGGNEPAASCALPTGTLRGMLAGAAYRDDLVRIEGLWAADGVEYPFKLEERRLPDGVGLRLVPRRIRGASDDVDIGDRIARRTTDDPARPFDVDVTYPELVGPAGRPVAWFSREVDDLLFRLFVGFELSSRRADGEADPASEPLLAVDYELAYASPTLLSVVFRVRESFARVPRSDRYDEFGLNVDLRARAIVRLAGQFRSRALAIAVTSDLNRAVVGGTIFDDGFEPDGLPGDLGGWHLDERGLVLDCAVYTLPGATAQLVVPWAFVRHHLRPSSPLGRAAFARRPPPRKWVGRRTGKTLASSAAPYRTIGRSVSMRSETSVADIER